MSAREVGGDFYDFIDMGEEKAGMLIGDVTGKSVSGALVMSASRSIFRMLSEEDRTVGDIMIRANRRTKKDIKSGMFVALLYAVVDAKERTVDLCSAGQTQPIHLAADTGDVHLVETEGDTFPLGILEDVEYVDTRVTLKPGDTVVFYTDGIVEAMNARGRAVWFRTPGGCHPKFHRFVRPGTPGQNPRPGKHIRRRRRPARRHHRHHYQGRRLTLPVSVVLWVGLNDVLHFGVTKHRHPREGGGQNNILNR